MALRARLVAPPPPEREEWPYHKAKVASLPAHLLWSGDRRLEAENYLASGYGIRMAIQEHEGGWVPLGDIASVWQPNRLKGILVSPDFGTPFLVATQLFDIRPVPRKWLAIDKIGDASKFFVDAGNILVTRSGSVGRSTLASEAAEGILISDDLLRIEPKQHHLWGWIYAYLRSPQARAMMGSAQYGHMIKHLETSHMDVLPIPEVSIGIANHFKTEVQELLHLRNRSHTQRSEAERLFSEAIGEIPEWESETSFTVTASALNGGRRRLEANFHAPFPAAILKAFAQGKRPVQPLSDVTDRIWWMSRFKRFYGEAGIPYLSADELFAVNPIEGKRILVDPEDSHRDYFVQPGWIVMACSGQVYGLNGAAMLMTEHHKEIFFSHDLIRIIPNHSAIRPGYLLTTLTHPVLGRPLLIRNAYGTSIPHLDPNDVGNFPVVRLESAIEGRIADLAESAVECHAKADALDRRIAVKAGEMVDQFIAGETLKI